MIKAVAWKLRDGSETEKTYRLQIDHCSTKSDKKLFACFDQNQGWMKAGEIYYPNNESRIGYIFQGTFKDESQWKKWCKSFPYSLTEISSISERVKSSNIGAKSHETVGRPKGRRCGKCGQLGHNARTCKGEKVDKSHVGKSKVPRKHRKKCGCCGKLDHNIRTCPKRK